MEKTCYGCKAFFIDPPSNECVLGYEMDIDIPKVECPKPRSNKEFIKCELKYTTKYIPFTGGYEY